MTEVKRLREKLGLSQDAFAARLGVAPYTVRRWESGKTKPSPMARRTIEEVFGMLQQSTGTEIDQGSRKGAT